MPTVPPDTAERQKDAVATFVGHLYELFRRDDRGALAQLRRAHTEGTDETMLQVVGHAMPERLYPRDLDAYLLTAGLFGVYVAGAAALPDLGRMREHRRSLGGSARIALDNGASDSFKTRFAALLARPWEDLPDELRRVLRLLRSHDAPVDFPRLLRHLLLWNHPERPVQRRWAADLWQGARKPSETADA